MRGPESELNVGLDLQDERASANGYSMVFMRQAYPNMALMTYDDEHHQGDHHVLLCKMVVGILRVLRRIHHRRQRARRTDQPSGHGRSQRYL